MGKLPREIGVVFNTKERKSRKSLTEQTYDYFSNGFLLRKANFKKPLSSKSETHALSLALGIQILLCDFETFCEVRLFFKNSKLRDVVYISRFSLQ